MATKGTMFAGCTVAMVTPLKNGEVDEAALRASVDWQVEQGTPTLAPVGTTGESPTLTHTEHEMVIATVIEQSAGRAKVMAGTGSNSTTEAVRLTKYAAKAGADGALIVAPYYNRPTQEGLYAHFAKISESVDLPIILYNIPSRTGRNIEPETVERLCKIASIVAIKEAAGSLDQVSDILDRTNLTVLAGDDSLTLSMLAVGGEGVVSVVGNIVPQDVIRLIEAFQAGNLALAQSIHRHLYPLCRDLLGLASNPTPIKAALALLGRGTGEVRLPMVPLDERLTDQLRKSLVRYGLLKPSSS